MSEQAAIRRAQHIRELRASSIRAMSRQAGLHFRGSALYRGARSVPMPVPHLHPPTDRGTADGMALRLRHTDPCVHAELRPEGSASRLVFEMLEQFRVESLVPSSWPGVRRNLTDRFSGWSREFEASGSAETDSGLLLFTVAQVCRSWITAEPIADWTQDLIEGTRFDLASTIGPELRQLRRNRHSQKDFGLLARAVSERIANLPQLNTEEVENDPGWDAFAWLLDGEPDDDAPSGVRGGGGRTLRDQSAAYRVFTTDYDETRSLETLLRTAQIQEYRERVDRAVEAGGVSARALGRRLARMFAEPHDDGWEGGHGAGYVDGRRLAQLVATPNERNIFRDRAHAPSTDTVISFLVDCSGSMKAFAEPVAVLVDVYARALELAGVGCEVLGFTTASWNGGRARREWIRSGRPRNPGRLNEVRHLVIKGVDTPYRRARSAMAGLLKLDLYREGIDGEAVAWACNRLRSCDQRRRILVVVSDGSPMDSATSLANDRNYLDHHLRDVLAAESDVDICAVGVGLDLSIYYDRCTTLDLTQGTTRGVLSDVLATIASLAKGGQYR